MDGTLHIDGRVSDAMVVRAMRAVAIDGLGMPADFVRRTRVPQVLVDLLREHPCPHGQGNIRLPFGFSVCTCCLDPHMNTPARLMMAHKDVAGAKRYVHKRRVRSRRPVVWRRFHFIQTRRFLE